MDKNCAFQFATYYKIFEDTELITLNEAKDLFNSNIDKFKEEYEKGNDPEMVIWINMKNSGNYAETFIHWIGSEIKVIDGVFYEMKPLISRLEKDSEKC